MKLHRILSLSYLFFALTAITHADETTVVLDSPDTDKTDTHDRGVGMVRMRFAKKGQTVDHVKKPILNPTPPSPEGDLPPTEGGKEPPPLPAVIMGEEIAAKSSFIFMMDVTGSMWGQKINALKEKLASDIKGLNKNVSFNIYAYAGRFNSTNQAEGWCEDTKFGCTSALFPEDKREGTPENIAAAVNWLESGSATNASGTNPDWYSLNYVVNHRLPDDIKKFFYLSDGGVYGDHRARILADFPGWWAPHSDKAHFIGISYQAQGDQQQFMQLLTASVGGTYIQRD